MKWETLGALKLSFHGEKKVEVEEDVTKAAPVSAKETPSSAKPPPPAPPSTYSRDRAVGKGSGKIPKEVGGGFEGNRGDSKGNSKGKEPKGKADNKGGKTLTKVKEEDPDAASSHYSPRTAREETWGVLSRQKDYEYQKWQDSVDWHWGDNEWKWGKSRSAKTNEEKKTLGFGEYHN